MKTIIILFLLVLYKVGHAPTILPLKYLAKLHFKQCSQLYFEIIHIKFLIYLRPPPVIKF